MIHAAPIVPVPLPRKCAEVQRRYYCFSDAQLEPGPDLPISLQAQSTRWLSGIPRAVIVFRILQPTLASTRCPCSMRLRIVGPKMVLAWVRLKAVIGESELGEYTGTVVRDQESRTKAH